VTTSELLGTRPLPLLDENRPLVLPAQVDRVLPNGLAIQAIRRPSVPLAEVRLRVPFAHADLAVGAVLAQTLFAGTGKRSNVEIAAELQKVGGGLDAELDPDRLMIGGNSLASGLDRLLELLAEVLDDAAYPAGEVETERERLADRIQVAESQPSHLARVALLDRIYAGHPYQVQTPSVGQVRAVSAEQVRELHRQRIHPNGATLILVGDFDPEQMLDLVARRLGDWPGTGDLIVLPPVPPLTAGPLLFVDRPGAVQSSLRIALPAVTRTHPDHAALQLANLIFGGYFSSRWVENIREDKGYTYGPHSMIEHSVAGSSLVVAAEVATEVSAPALVETVYELGRLAALPPEPAELEQARQYALGTLQLGMSTQAGLAGLASTYAGFGLRLDFLAEHSAKLAAATPEDVHRVATTYLAPSRAVAVLLGDADKVADAVAAITPIEVRRKA
jgi:predicted Zn-dependent peptidase